MNSLVSTHNFNPTLIGLGFCPAKIKENLIAIADIKNDRELHFELENHEFVSYSPQEFKGNVPEKIKKVVEKENSWFDEFEIIAPEKRRVQLADPFLFGKKDGKYYYICSWDTDIWEKE